MKRIHHLRSSSNSISKAELKPLDSDLQRLGRFFNEALCIPLRKLGETAPLPLRVTRKARTTAVKRNCSVKSLKVEPHSENDSPNVATKPPHEEKISKGQGLQWRRLAQLKLCRFARHLAGCHGANRRATEHRQIRLILSCLQEWRTVAHQIKQEQELAHKEVGQIAALGSLVTAFRLEDRLNSSYEAKCDRPRSHSPCYFRRPLRKSCESKLTPATSDLHSYIEPSASEALADAFRKRACLFYYGLQPFRKLLTVSFIRREHKAKVEAVQSKLKRKAVERWLEFYVSRHEEVYKPRQHFEMSLTSRVLRSWPRQVKDPLKAAADNFLMVRTRQLTFGARVFDAWRAL
jgi:hypothetical protein